MRNLKNILVTGQTGFIGSNFIRCLFGKSTADENLFDGGGFSGTVVNMDSLTYVGNIKTLKVIETIFSL